MTIIISMFIDVKVRSSWSRHFSPHNVRKKIFFLHLIVAVTKRRKTAGSDDDFADVCNDPVDAARHSTENLKQKKVRIQMGFFSLWGEPFCLFDFSIIQFDPSLYTEWRKQCPWLNERKIRSALFERFKTQRKWVTNEYKSVVACLQNISVSYV